MENNLVIFEGKHIRQIEHGGETWFSIVDIIEILSDSKNPQSYWGKLKERENQLLTNCQKFKFLAPDGKMRSTDCANTEGVLRIIQSVPSPKAEPFKLWMAALGKQSLVETADPELSIERLRELYRTKGYSDKWIETRLKSIGIRKELTDEWQKRGIKEGEEYAILTAEIAKATFGLSPREHADLKGLQKENLRDHMTNLELIFTMLGEEATRTIAVRDDAQGLQDNQIAAADGGRIAGDARKKLEERTQEKVVSTANFLEKPESFKEIE
jgi:prophage antirepressor-like protein